MSRVEIGSKYDGPCFDKPCLRQLPRHWTLEESKRDHRPAWYRKVPTWAAIILVLWFLLGFVQLAKSF